MSIKTTVIGPRTTIVNGAMCVRFASCRRQERRRLIIDPTAVEIAQCVARQSEEWSIMLEVLGEPRNASMIALDGVAIVREVSSSGELYHWRTYEQAHGSVLATDIKPGETIVDLLERVGVEFWDLVADAEEWRAALCG